MPLRTYLKLLTLLLALTALGTIALVPSTYAQDLWGSRAARSEAVMTRLPDGTAVLEYPDRTVEIRFANLLRMTVTPDDQVIVAGTDSTITRTRLTIQQGEMSDGTKINAMSNGSLRIDLTDGSFIMVGTDNEVTLGRSRAPDAESQTRLQQQTVLCTFIPYRTVNLRAGPGSEYDRVDQAPGEEELSVIGQGTSTDFYIWWQVLWPDVEGEVYVRSDLGESDCDAVCGNDVCEYGETSAICAADCGSGTGGGGVSTTTTSASTNTTNLTSTGVGCYVSNCTECYESVSCYPTCNECTCSKNTYGCVTCYCTEPGSTATASASLNTTGTTTTTSTSASCDFATCEDCIAAFPCYPGACSVTQCELNEFGCPVCSTAP